MEALGMFRQYTEVTSIGSNKNVRRLCLLLLFSGVGLVSVYATTPAQAAVEMHGNHGNGRNNRNSISINSPTISRGAQHMDNNNIGGRYYTQAAFCKKKLHCRISQRIVAYR
jgi:hypothetical protein